MIYDWRTIVPPHLIQPSEHVDCLDRRVSEMSPKEWRQLKGAMEMLPQDDLAGVIALTECLGSFSYYFPAPDYDEAGYLLAKHNYGVRDDVLPFINPSEVFMEYQGTNGGVIVDEAFISGCSAFSANHIEATAEAIRVDDVIVDRHWSAKLYIEGPSGDCVWIRLPDYEETTGEQDEIATALMEVDAESLDECTLLKAKCIFPQIDLMRHSTDLKMLAFDASNLGYALFEQDRRVEHFDEKLHYALEYEQCDDVNFAIDIISNIDCYDFVPSSNLRSTAEEFMPAQINKQPVILAAFNYEDFAANHLRSIGMHEVDGGFFMRNRHEFHFDYSLPPDEQAAKDYQKDLVHRLDAAMDRCWEHYKSERQLQEADWVFDCASDIVQTENAYNTFRHGDCLTNEMMEQLLQFENPLIILRDAWARGIEHEDNHQIQAQVQKMLSNPLIGESHDLLPGFSGRPEPTEHEQQMGGYDGQGG